VAVLFCFVVTSTWWLPLLWPATKGPNLWAGRALGTVVRAQDASVELLVHAGARLPRCDTDVQGEMLVLITPPNQ